jgi:hypothetical protein
MLMKATTLVELFVSEELLTSLQVRGVCVVGVCVCVLGGVAMIEC